MPELSRERAGGMWTWQRDEEKWDIRTEVKIRTGMGWGISAINTGVTTLSLS